MNMPTFLRGVKDHVTITKDNLSGKGARDPLLREGVSCSWVVAGISQVRHPGLYHKNRPSRKCLVSQSLRSNLDSLPSSELVGHIVPRIARVSLYLVELDRGSPSS